jgi:hypothetical protein
VANTASVVVKIMTMAAVNTAAVSRVAAIMAATAVKIMATVRITVAAVLAAVVTMAGMAVKTTAMAVAIIAIASWAAAVTTAGTAVKSAAMVAVRIIAAAVSVVYGTGRVTRSAPGSATATPSAGAKRMRCVPDNTGGGVPGVTPDPTTGSATTSMTD